MEDATIEKKLSEKRSYLETEVAESLVSGSMFSFYPSPLSAVLTGAGGEGNAFVTQRIDHRSSLPHKKRRPLPEEEKKSLVGSTINLLRQRDGVEQQPSPFLGRTLSTKQSLVEEGGSRPTSELLSDLSSTVYESSPPVASIRECAAPPSALLELRGTKSASATPKKKNVEAAWMHRLYPFDGPTIEEFTPLFNNVDVDRLVEDKLASMRDKGLAQAVKSYYAKVINLDHNEYKAILRPPNGTPDDIRPFLLSQRQLKSFNSDFLRSALRKIKVNKSFCTLLRGTAVKGVPLELRNLGNEAFARSIRTHQIIAFFTRYYSVYLTKFPGKVLDLADPEHKICLDCLKDIVRRVSAKRAIQLPVVAGDHFAASQHESLSASPSNMETARGEVVNDGANYRNEANLKYKRPHVPISAVDASNDFDDVNSHEDDVSKEGTLVTNTSTLADADEKENKVESLDTSFDSSSSTSFGRSICQVTGVQINVPATPLGRDPMIAYGHVLSMLSDDARRAVEEMVDTMRRKVEEEAKTEVCKRSFEQGRKVGQMEGRTMATGGFSESLDVKASE